jgi:hypothetical protein
MPINYALILCIPIGLLFYFGARWLLRFLLGRYEQKERRAALFFGAFGALSIPLIYCSGLVGDTIGGRLGETVDGVLFAVAALGLIGPLLKTLINGEWRGVARDD